MIVEDGQKNVLRWQAAALVGGTVLSFLGVSFVLFSKSPGGLRSTGWWTAGIAGGLLAAAFTFPVSALESDELALTQRQTVSFV